MMTADRLRELLDYYPGTGGFFWRVNKGRSIAGDIAGNRRSDGYIKIKLDQKDYLAHRLAWLWIFGIWPIEIDHISGNRADNRIENLRECTRSQNFANRKQLDSKELPKGVRLFRKRYQARVVFKGKEFNLGMYDTAEQARVAYEKGAREFYGEFARSDIVRAPRER